MMYAIVHVEYASIAQKNAVKKIIHSTKHDVNILKIQLMISMSTYLSTLRVSTNQMSRHLWACLWTHMGAVISTHNLSMQLVKDRRIVGKIIFFFGNN